MKRRLWRESKTVENGEGSEYPSLYSNPGRYSIHNLVQFQRDGNIAPCLTTI